MKIDGLKPSAPFWIGAGVILLAPVVAPAVRAAWKSLFKAVIAEGVRSYRMAKAAFIAASESAVELYEEARVELDDPST